MKCPICRTPMLHISNDPEKGVVRYYECGFCNTEWLFVLCSDKNPNPSPCSPENWSHVRANGCLAIYDERPDDSIDFHLDPPIDECDTLTIQDRPGNQTEVAFFDVWYYQIGFVMPTGLVFVTSEVSV